MEEAQESPDAIVWPETVITSGFEGAGGLQSDVAAFVRELATPLVLGVARWEGVKGGYRNSVLWIAPGEGAR